MTIRETITQRLSDLETALNEQIHLTNPTEVTDLIQSITKFISVLSDEDIDYVQSAMIAVDEELIWDFS